MSADLDRERLAVLVHEVRSPVAALAAVAEAAGERSTDRALRVELVRLALAACAAIERIVLDLAVSSVRLEAVDVRRLARETAAAFRLGGADVVARVESDPFVVQADPVRLRQVLDNLVRNALVHGGGADPVQISVERTEAAALITVSDSGRGIPPADLDRIFGPGVRLDARTPGSGLGLALTRALVEAHGGSIAAESREATGTIFTVSLPEP
jgi:signal transduction histidine kinase